MKIASQILIGIYTVLMAICTLFVILGLLLFLFTGVIYTNNIEETSHFPTLFFVIIFGGFIVFGILSTILGIAAMVKLGKAKCKKDVLVKYKDDLKNDEFRKAFHNHKCD